MPRRGLIAVPPAEQAQLAQRIREVRRKAGLSQGQFAAALSCSTAHISGIETKRHNPSAAFLKRIAEVFRVSEDWLISGVGEMGDARLSGNGAVFIGDRIKQVRTRWCLTQTEFAKLLGTTRLMVKYLENGQKSVAGELMDAICQTFCVSPTWLKTGEGTMTEGRVLRIRF